MPDTTQEWRVGQAEFQGFMKAKMEDNDAAHEAIVGRLDKQNGRLRCAEKDISVLKVKSGMFGAIGGAIILGGRSIIRLITGV